MRDLDSWQVTNQEYLEYLERLIQEAQTTRDLVGRINRLPLPGVELEKLNTQRKQEAAIALAYYGARDRLFELITGQASLRRKSA